MLLPLAPTQKRTAVHGFVLSRRPHAVLLLLPLILMLMYAAKESSKCNYGAFQRSTGQGSCALRSISDTYIFNL